MRSKQTGHNRVRMWVVKPKQRATDDKKLFRSEGICTDDWATSPCPQSQTLKGFRLSHCQIVHIHNLHPFKPLQPLPLYYLPSHSSNKGPPHTLSIIHWSSCHSLQKLLTQFKLKSKRLFLLSLGNVHLTLTQASQRFESVCLLWMGPELRTVTHNSALSLPLSLLVELELRWSRGKPLSMWVCGVLTDSHSTAILHSKVGLILAHVLLWLWLEYLFVVHFCTLTLKPSFYQKHISTRQCIVLFHAG